MSERQDPLFTTSTTEGKGIIPPFVVKNVNPDQLPEDENFRNDRKILGVSDLQGALFDTDPQNLPEEGEQS